MHTKALNNLSLKELLRQGIQHLPPDFGQIVYEEALNLVKNFSSFYRDAFRLTLERGLTFHVDDIPAYASYFPDRRLYKIVFSRAIATIPQSKEQVRQIVSLALKHELTHAADDLSLSSHKPHEYNALYKSVLTFSSSVFDFVSALRRGQQIDPDVLRQFLPIMPKQSPHAQHYRIDNNRPYLDFYQSEIKSNAVAAVGTESNGYRYITQYFDLARNLILEVETYNPVAAEEFFRNNTDLVRGYYSPPAAHDPVVKEAMSSLPRELQNLVDTFFVVIHNAMKFSSPASSGKSDCTPKLVVCVQQSQPHCLRAFFSCNEKMGTLTYTRSITEVHAALRERFNLNALPKNISLTDAYRPDTRPINTSLMQTHPTAFLFGFSFINASLDMAMRKIGLGNWSSSLLKIMIQAVILMSTGMDFGAAMSMSTAFFFIDIFAKSTNLGRIETRLFAVNTTQALLLLPQLRSLSSTKELATSMAASTAGAVTAISVGHIISRTFLSPPRNENNQQNKTNNQREAKHVDHGKQRVQVLK